MPDFILYFLKVVTAHFVLHTELSWFIGGASLLIGLSTYLYYKPPPKVRGLFIFVGCFNSQSVSPLTTHHTQSHEQRLRNCVRKCCKLRKSRTKKKKKSSPIQILWILVENACQVCGPNNQKNKQIKKTNKQNK